MFCYFHISIAGSEPQTVVFELYNDKCPKTCANFIALCQAPGKAKRGGSIATYRNTQFHRIIPQFMIQGGDFTSFDGNGGHAHPSTNDGKPIFDDECFDIPHDQAGILSTNKGKNTNGSQFFITLGKTLHLNGKHTAFGKVVRGIDVVHEIAKVETEGDRPVAMQRVIIVDCGIGTGDEKDDSSGSASDSSSSISSSSSSSSRHDRKRKHKSKSKKRRHKTRDRDDDSSHKKSKKRCSHSKHSKRHKRDEYKRKKKDKRSHRLRHDRSGSSSDDDHRRHSSKKKRKHNR